MPAHRRAYSVEGAVSEAQTEEHARAAMKTGGRPKLPGEERGWRTCKVGFRRT
ncbi:MAG: hypothetical protein JOZ19_00685 [Rubrobacter sp.]|nr:hypothetical protein [Rubrobacter sp.]